MEPDFYEGTQEIWYRYCQGNGQGKSCAALPEEMYNRMMRNVKSGRQPSPEDWRKERKTDIDDINQSPEKCLEKAVAILAECDHMPGWYNQVPTASGVTGGTRSKHANVDLVHWDDADKHLRLVELKWMSNDPVYALFEALKCGLSYIFFRTEWDSRTWQLIYLRPSHVSLEVVAPQPFFDKCAQPAWFPEIGDALTSFAKSKIGKDSPPMSVRMLAFPPEFCLPFANGKVVKAQCDTHILTPEGKCIRDAFAALSPVWT